jgi:hypothetical protein
MGGSPRSTLFDSERFGRVPAAEWRQRAEAIARRVHELCADPAEPQASPLLRVRLALAALLGAASTAIHALPAGAIDGDTGKSCLAALRRDIDNAVARATIGWIRTMHEPAVGRARIAYEAGRELAYLAVAPESRQTPDAVVDYAIAAAYGAARSLGRELAAMPASSSVQRLSTELDIEADDAAQLITLTDDPWKLLVAAMAAIARGFPAGNAP